MRYLGLIFSLLIATSCAKLELPEEVTGQAPLAATEMEDLQIPSDFEFQTSRTVQVQTTLALANGEPLKQVPVKVYDALPDSGGHVIMQAFTDASGIFETEVVLPAHLEKFYLVTQYIGVIAEQELDAKAASVTFNWGEKPVTEVNTDRRANTNRVAASQSGSLYYAGSYNSKGYPDYLEPTRDVIDQDFLNFVNANLPEGYPVPSFNASYIAEVVETDIKLTAEADVWITFVHEGAGYKNAVGYYTYDVNDPPATANDIDSLILLFPNLSYPGAGNMVSGDKVKLGRFQAGTGIGWFIVPDGWKANQVSVQPQFAKNLKYSNPDFNTFASAGNESHMVILKDRINELILLGFEDISRPGGDKDFNDAVFYVTASPFSAIDTENILSADGDTEDADLDGVPDIFDAAITNAVISSSYYSPAQDVYGTLAFEDFWPQKGDFDFNDLVIDYNYEFKTNANNRVTEVVASFILRAIGAGYHNGFGFVLNTDASNIGSVTGQRFFSPNKVTLASNGVENGQTDAVIIVFDDGYGILRNPDVSTFVNTQTSAEYVQPETLSVTVTLSTPVLLRDLISAGQNPFIFTGRGRGYEVHLPGQQPTALANTSYFGTGDDATDQNTVFYQTAEGLPWALNFVETWTYPQEKKRVLQCYTHFQEWAESGGSLRAAWYLDRIGHRNTSDLYIR
ncbi:MAG: LruC domain-containing protein [Bacteroidota bacterium]